MEIKVPFYGTIQVLGIGKKTPLKETPRETVIKTESGPLPISAGRSSDPDLPTTLLDILLEEASIIAPEYQVELIGVLEHLGKWNADISYAIENIVQLGNTPYDISFNDDIPASQVKKMRQELSDVENNWYAYSGGIQSLRNDLLAQGAVTGAISGEAVPTESLDGIKKIVLVSPKNVRFAYNKGFDIYEPYQKLNNMIGIRRDAVNGLIKLNVTTYKYYAVRRFNESPYAIPPFLAALDSIAIEKDMMDSFKHVVKKLGVLGFLKVLVKAPIKATGQSDADYQAAADNQLLRTATEIDKGIKKGYVIGFDGMHSIDMQTISTNVTGATDLIKVNNEMKMAGLKQDPLMLGRNYSTTETVGRVILAKLSAQLQNYQMLVDKFIGETMYLHLILKGYKGLKYVKVESRKPLLADEGKEQEAYSKKIDNYDKLYKQGVISQTQRANALGFENPDQEEPREVIQTIEPANPDPVDSKVEDPTDTEDTKLVRLPSNAIDALKKAEKHVFFIDLEIKGVGVNRYDVHGDSVASTGFSTGDIIDFHIPDNQLEEGLLEAEEILSADSPEFDYTVTHVCGHSHEESLAKEEHFAADRDKGLNRYIGKYRRDIGANFTKAVGKVSNLVTKELLKFDKGASVQEVQDAVLYIIYKNWPEEFSKKNRKYITKWVQESYRYFRNDLGVFPSATNIPKAALNLKDLRTMEYYKKSDTLYLGKFITDEDTKKKVTEYIKKKYLDESLPINDKKDLANSFKAEFGDTLVKEGWKIDRIINTTVNKMRNTAAVHYMEQAGVERFTIVGIKDRLQCGYCAELNGKEFEVSHAVSSASSLAASSPEEVREKTPFVTSIFKSPEDLKGLSMSELQKAGVALPGYHGHCRCAISAVL